MNENTIQIIVCILLACFPAYIWGYIFYKKEPEPRRLTLITFLVGGLSVIPILAYKYSWKLFPEINAFTYTNTFQNNYIGIENIIVIPISVVLTFMIVGVIEEYMKHLSVRAIDEDKFMNIDDAIEYSIIAALGFAFVENIMYFFYIWQNQGIKSLFISFIFRAIFSTFAHILFSGMYGYFYGIARFAHPILQEEINAKKRFPIIRFFHKIFRIKSELLFEKEKILEGLLVAVSLHAFFNIMLEMNWIYLMTPFLFAGYAVLDHLFKLKENHKEYGKLVDKNDQL